MGWIGEGLILFYLYSPPLCILYITFPYFRLFSKLHFHLYSYICKVHGRLMRRAEVVKGSNPLSSNLTKRFFESMLLCCVISAARIAVILEE